MVGTCLTDIDLESFHAGDLSAEVTMRLTGHIEGCDSCRGSYERFLSDQVVLGRVRKAARAVRTDSPSSYLATQMMPRLVPAVPRDIKGFDIRREIQRGGQGVVYEAVQLSAQRTVALKILLEDPFADPAVRRRRFQSEIELASNLRHPNIVTIHDSGLVDGHFYYAMEYIEGQRLGEYLDSTHLNIRECVRLFEQICTAVSYAHQSGVIHRDLKPSNIRVDAEGTPHLLDFGLAQRFDQSATVEDDSDSHFLGTLAYASPEQVGGGNEPVDTRSDVYALGVLLYQMINGRPPYPVTGDMREVIVHIKSTAPAEMNGSVDRDLRAIICKALSKNAAERYRAAGHFQDDVQRYLRGAAVQARPQRLSYLLGKWARRHRGQVSAAVLALVLAAGFGGWHVQQVQLERDEAVAQRQSAEQIQQFLEQTLAAAPASEDFDHADLRAMLGQAARRVERELADQPLGQASVRTTIGRTYQSLGQYEQADFHLAAALELFTEALGSNHLRVADALTNVAQLRRDQGRLDEALRLQEDAISLASGLGVGVQTIAEYIANLATIQHKRQDYEEAARHYDQSLLFLEDPIRRADTQRSYASLFETLGQHGRARGLYEEVLKVYATFDVPALEVAAVRANLAELLESQGAFSAAQEQLRAALALIEKSFGRQSLAAARVMSMIAESSSRAGRHATALTLAEEALDIRRTELGPDHELVGRTLKVLAALHHGLGDLPQAVASYERALEILRQQLGERHLETVSGQGNLARVLYDKGQYAEAAEAWEQVLATQRDTLGEHHAAVATTLNNLGMARHKLGENIRALGMLLNAHDLRIELLGERHPDVAESKMNLASYYLNTGQLTHSETYYRQGLEILRAVLPEDDLRIGQTLINLGKVLRAEAKGHPPKQARPLEDSALQAYEEALAVFEKALPANHPLIATVNENMAFLFKQQQRYALATRHYRTALAVGQGGANPWRVALTQRLLGLCLIPQQHFDEAEQLLLASFSTLRETFGTDHKHTRLTMKALRNLYEASNNTAEAQRYRDLLGE